MFEAWIEGHRGVLENLNKDVGSDAALEAAFFAGYASNSAT